MVALRHGTIAGESVALHVIPPLSVHQHACVLCHISLDLTRCPVTPRAARLKAMAIRRRVVTQFAGAVTEGTVALHVGATAPASDVVYPLEPGQLGPHHLGSTVAARPTAPNLPRFIEQWCSRLGIALKALQMLRAAWLQMEVAHLPFATVGVDADCKVAGWWLRATRLGGAPAVQRRAAVCPASRERAQRGARMWRSRHQISPRWQGGEMARAQSMRTILRRECHNGRAGGGSERDRDHTGDAPPMTHSTLRLIPPIFLGGGHRAAIEVVVGYGVARLIPCHGKVLHHGSEGRSHRRRRRQAPYSVTLISVTRRPLTPRAAPAPAQEGIGLELQCREDDDRST